MEILGRATTRWGDFVGTAGADGAYVAKGSRSLYELAGLDRDGWRIVAIDLGLRLGIPAVVVYATDVSDLVGGEDLLVSAFEITDQERVLAFLIEAFDTVAVRLVSREFSQRTIRVLGESSFIVRDAPADV